MTALERALVALGDSYLSHQLLISMSLPGTLCMFSCWVVDYASNLSDQKKKKALRPRATPITVGSARQCGHETGLSEENWTRKG